METDEIIDTVHPKNPFPGLRPFNTEEAEFFFGREDQVTELLDRLTSTHFLAIVGSSGCGKSSLVRAGLLPELQDGFMAIPELGWRIAITSPGDDPTGRLARKLAEGLDVPADQVNKNLRRGSHGLIEVAEQANLADGRMLFILVDQFEELFRFLDESDRHTAHDEARSFVKLLLAAAAQDRFPIYIGLTMRSEYLGNCTQFSALPEAINEGLYLVPRLDREQLREVIEEPINMLDRKITNRLVDRLLNQIGNDPDQLPILQHTLMRLWSISQTESDSPTIDIEHLQQIGGFDGALEQHIKEIFADLTPRQASIAEVVFRDLTELTEDGRKVRKPIKTADRLAIESRAHAKWDEINNVVARFSSEGRSFLRVEGDVIDISHEALIRQWHDLDRWTVEEADWCRIAQNVIRKAKDWNQAGANGHSF